MRAEGEAGGNRITIHIVIANPPFCHCEERSDEAISSLPRSSLRGHAFSFNGRGNRLYLHFVIANPSFCHCEERSDEAISPFIPYGVIYPSRHCEATPFPLMAVAIATMVFILLVES